MAGFRSNKFPSNFVLRWSVPEESGRGKASRSNPFNRCSVLILKSFAGYVAGLSNQRHHRTLQPRKKQGGSMVSNCCWLLCQYRLLCHCIWVPPLVGCRSRKSCLVCTLLKGIQHSYSIKISQKQMLVPFRIWGRPFHYFHCRSSWMTKQIICLGDLCFLLLEALPLYWCNWGCLTDWYKNNMHLGSRQLTNVNFKLDRDYTLCMTLSKTEFI